MYIEKKPNPDSTISQSRYPNGVTCKASSQSSHGVIVTWPSDATARRTVEGNQGDDRASGRVIITSTNSHLSG